MKKKYLVLALITISFVVFATGCVEEPETDT